jgi:bacterioferritin-associated ferredoxin
MGVTKIHVELENRDRIELTCESSGEAARVTGLRASGCLELLNQIKTLKGLLPAKAADLFVFPDQGHATLMINEALLKALGEWKYPYQEEELCHCRAIPLAKVDAAIVAGFHTVQEIAEQTSAGTACGSCRPDSQSCIEYRLKDPAKARRESSSSGR